MKRLLLLLLTIMLCIGTQAQVNNDLIIEHLEKCLKTLAKNILTIPNY